MDVLMCMLLSRCSQTPTAIRTVAVQNMTDGTSRRTNKERTTPTNGAVEK